MTTTKAVKHWRIYCETESVFQHWYLPINASGPTTCPNDTAHTVNPNSVSELGEIANQQVKIQEEDVPTGGNFAAKGWEPLSINSGVDSVTTDFVSFDWPISALDITFEWDTDNIGDKIDVYVSPDTIVGSITTDVSASSTVIPVDSTAMAHCAMGFKVKLDDGTNANDLGFVTARDTINNTLTVQTATTNAFVATTPTYVKMTVHKIQNVYLGPSKVYHIGENKIGGSYVPTGSSIQLYYTNKDGVANKKVYYHVDHLH